ncbi:MAG: GNAT family N-acetyltransferase [Alphaproteobacteria bacterium]
MPEGDQRLTVKAVSKIAAVAAEDWDSCLASAHPFLCHAFLSALEESGCVAAKTGWQPQHLIVEDSRGRVVGAAPAYLKGHSYGEYVFDWGWAEAYERAGGRYYPKLQVAVPFTPVAGPRLLVRPGAPGETAEALIHGLVSLARRLDASSIHITFPIEPEWRRLGEAGWLLRMDQQFHWVNRGYASFEDFLASLASRKRKQIRKERRAVADSGIRLSTLTGAELSPTHWDSFHRFYMTTARTKWGNPYLNRAFFHRIGECLADRIVLIMAEAEGRFVAGALNLMGDGVLYGRNWGCLADYKFLHFEACYYQAIEFAIAHGLGRVEAGAQGPHKIQRGYLPMPTYSAHWIADAGLRAAVEDYLKRERAHVAREMEELSELAPYRRATEDEY